MDRANPLDPVKPIQSKKVDWVGQVGEENFSFAPYVSSNPPEIPNLPS
jgi:hypothetical protein